MKIIYCVPFSILGAISIIASAIAKRQVWSPKVYKEKS